MMCEIQHYTELMNGEIPFDEDLINIRKAVIILFFCQVNGTHNPWFKY